MTEITKGATVKVREPFSESSPGAYVVASVTLADDGQTVVYLEGVEPAFSPEYLENAE